MTRRRVIHIVIALVVAAFVGVATFSPIAAIVVGAIVLIAIEFKYSRWNQRRLTPAERRDRIERPWLYEEPKGGSSTGRK
jgi:hypothetical protein